MKKHRSSILRSFLKVVSCSIFAASMLFLSILQNSENTYAANMREFNPGNIISDAVMANYNSMSIADIQNFLNSKVSCNNRNYAYHQQLSAAYPGTIWHWNDGHFVCLPEERFGDGQVIGSGQTAAEIIWHAAQDYRINPQVLIVLLQKETRLITDPIPNSNDYRKATGYGCPDTAACDSKYYGFKNQIRNAAALFRDVLDRGYAVYPEKRAGVTVAYHPNAACGRSQVYIENRATAALYRYTPYQPNAASLNAGYGTGDSCSSYGNRNFYSYFTDWFGSTQAYVKGEAVTIPDGIYTIKSSLGSNTILGANGNNAELVSSNQAEQRWKFERVNNSSYYKIINTSNNRLLDVAAANMNAGTNLQAWSATGTCAQEWKIYRTNENYYTFESACTPGLVADVVASNNRVGTNVTLWFTNNGRQQQWELLIGRTIEDGTYTIAAKNNPNKVVDVAGIRDADGTNIQLWDKNGGIQQKWTFTYDYRTDSYFVANPMSGRLLDIQGANINRGTNVQLWQNVNKCTQRWRVNRTDDGYYTLTSACSLNRALDLLDGNTRSGNNVWLWETNGDNAQKWKIEKTNQPLSNGTYTIAAKNNPNKVVDVAGIRDADGTNIQLWDKNGGIQQKWTFTYDYRTDSYFVANPMSGRLLDIQGANINRGTNVQLWQNVNKCTQRWRVNRTDDGYYTLTSACSLNRALDLLDGNTRSGNNVWLWETNGDNAQKWKIEKTR